MFLTHLTVYVFDALAELETFICRWTASEAYKMIAVSFHLGYVSVDAQKPKTTDKLSNWTTVDVFLDLFCSLFLNLIR